MLGVPLSTNDVMDARIARMMTAVMDRPSQECSGCSRTSHTYMRARSSALRK